MTTTYQLVFRGQFLPDHDPQIARSLLSAALKLAPEQEEKVFSGNRVILRKSLPEAEVARYLRHFENLGARVYVEPLPAIAPPAVTAPTPVVPVPAGPKLALAEIVEEMTCPKCGERQPKRTLCRNCAIDMKRFAEAKIEAEREAREARLAASRGETSADTSALAREALGLEAAGVVGIGFSGRIGRLDYLFGGFLCFAILLFGLAALMRSANVVLFLIASVLCFFFSMRLAALRCHDRGWSGWVSLIILVPYLGWLLGFLLMVLPGEHHANRFGIPKRPSPVPGMIAMAAVFALSLMMVLRSPDGVAQLQAMMIAPQKAAVGERVGRPSTGSAVTTAKVEIFTTTTCGECARAKSYMKRNGIQYVERDVEFDIETRKEFYERGGRGVPYIFVREQSMHGFDEGAFERLLSG